MTMYIVHPDRTMRLPDHPLCSKWYVGTDLPDPTYWRTTHDGQEIPEAERLAVPGESIGLVEIITEKHSFLGIPYECSSPRLLRLVRLEEGDVYFESTQHQAYKVAIASGELAPFVRFPQ